MYARRIYLQKLSSKHASIKCELIDSFVIRALFFSIAAEVQMVINAY